MKLTIKKVLVAVSMAWTTASQAAPILQYDFQYTSTRGVLAGSLMGELQADGNTIVVSSFLDFVTFKGVNGSSVPFVQSVLDFAGGPSAAPTVSLDGSMMDVIACGSADCSPGSGVFLFESSGTLPGYGGFPIADSTPAFGGFGEEYVASRWQIQSASVPEPGSLALVGLAFAGLSAFRRRTHRVLRATCTLQGNTG